MWFFLLGFATALETLGSHAYGAGNHRALVTCCVTAAVLTTLLVFPIALGMALGELAGRSLFGQDEHTAALMGRFCDGLIPGMWPLMWGIVLTKYLQVQNVMLAPSLVAVATFFINIGANAVLVSALGFSGAPLATTLSRWAQFLLMVGVTAHHERRRRREAGEGQPEALGMGPGMGTGMGQLELGLPTRGGAREGLEWDADARMGLGAGPPRARPSGSGSRKGTAGAGPRPMEEEDGVAPAEQRLLLDEAPASDELVWRPESGGLSAAGGSDDGHHMHHRSHQPHYQERELQPQDRYQAGAAVMGAGGGAGAGAASSSSSFWQEALEECREAVRPAALWRFLRLGIPGGLSLSFEAGCFDFATALAGRLGPVNTAAHAATLSVVTLTYLACPFALATAGAIRVGNLLGSGQPDAAQRAGILAVILSGTFMALMAIILLSCRHVLGYMFSTDPRVVRVIAHLALFAAIFQVSDGVMGASQGVLRGCGHQHLTAIFNFTGFWICGVLLGYLLCFKAGMGLDGLWLGICSGDTVTAVLNMVAMCRIRWQHEAHKAVARLKAQAEQAEEERSILAGDERSAAAAAGTDGDLGSSAIPPPVGGGGRSFAGGLKRIWSERRVAQAAVQARQQRQSLPQAGGVAAGQLLRSLSSFFRRGGRDGGDGALRQGSSWQWVEEGGESERLASAGGGGLSVSSTCDGAKTREEPGGAGRGREMELLP
ncbi:hypothetical protein GPECTOR_43g869 [Gonium pectorale]|uniref:Protein DETOXIFICATION n=1 Tax=Gonium pectorale TaxID=33097 RepID=A0A150G9J2_GONPE|nr:hypothetical protein GPECTOR_43g869 [Gonium pectorale]|eukprot:KXZ46433.1 hypothetical protein GPECTOR_43g869 [Gonium pectorale]